MQNLITSALFSQFADGAISEEHRPFVHSAASACSAWVCHFLPKLPDLDALVLVALAGYFGEAIQAPEFLFDCSICEDASLVGAAIAQTFLAGLDGRLVELAKSGAEDGTADAGFDALYALHGEKAFAMVGQV